ncbi:MAG: four helix bundle protein [Bacteroidales bacterium]|nr:four helix bundle protein [Bacteroidales bacterium]
MGKYEELLAFQISYGLAKKVFINSKGFPKEEIYSLTDQLRRSSRSICVNIVEAYRKRIYPKHFISKLSDADGECSETLVWLKMAYDFNYLDKNTFNELNEEYERVGRIIGSMMKNPEKFR